MTADDRTDKRPGVEGRLRRGLELLFLAVTLIAGVVVVGGCGTMYIFVADDGVQTFLAMLAGGLLVVGAVYLAISMSRDVRLLKQKLLEQENRKDQ